MPDVKCPACNFHKWQFGLQCCQFPANGSRVVDFHSESTGRIKHSNISELLGVLLSLKFEKRIPMFVKNDHLSWALCTLHLKIKKLSTNSLRDFNSVLDTINHYWIDPAKQFCPKSSSLSTIYDSFKSKVLKVVESKNGHHFY